MLDAMSIKKCIQYDASKGTNTGFVNLGVGGPTDSDDVATEVLVFMVVGLTGKWKAPVAYFLTNSLQATTQHKLVKHTIISLNEIGIQTCAMTLDGHATNVAMCSLFGCQMDPALELKSHFNIDGYDQPIYVFLDACHMIKLVRNLLQAYQIIKSPTGAIKWQYIHFLHQEQQTLGLRFANKLSQRHLEFQKQKMKVNLAVQTISSSVAKALQLMLQLKQAQFFGCEATIEFIQVLVTFN